MSAATLPAGAYGLTFPGLLADSLHPSPGDAWPAVAVAQVVAAADREAAATFVSEHRARLRLVGGGELLLDRRARRATFLTPRRLGEDELAHPYLGPVGAVFAGWLGRHAFHAGAFVGEGGAWAVLAEKEGGKSTTLAWLALAGTPVLTDDVLVVREGLAYAGPRCLDLRAEAAAGLDLAGLAEPARGGERVRLRPPAGPTESPLRGVVSLAWGTRVELSPLSPAERLTRLARARSGAGPDGAFLELTALPGWELRRPRELRFLPGACARLLDLAAS